MSESFGYLPLPDMPDDPGSGDVTLDRLELLVLEAEAKAELAWSDEIEHARAQALREAFEALASGSNAFE